MSSFFRHVGNAFVCFHPRASGVPQSVSQNASDTPSPADAPGGGRTNPAQRGPAAGADLASGLRFGVEVEHQNLSFLQVAESVRKHIKAADYDFCEARICCPDGRVWHLDEDAGGIELVTPIMRGREDLQVLQKIVATLQQAGGKTDARAGLHVHIDAARFSGKQMQTLVTLMTRNEHWLYPAWGVDAGRRVRWCREMDPVAVAEASALPLSRRLRLRRLYGGDRYFGLNLQNYLQPGGKNTIEFRYLNGTLDPCAIGCAVGFYMAVAERALESSGTKGALDTTRSSLPALLREMRITREHPVAAHLYGQLRERIACGWEPDDHGPLPDLDAFLRDDGCVERLCLALEVSDGPEEVAGIVRMMLATQSAEGRARMEQRAEAFAEAIQRCTSMPFATDDAMRIFERYLVGQAEIVPCLMRLSRRWSDMRRLREAVALIAKHVGQPEKLDDVCAVAMLCEPDDLDCRLRVLNNLVTRTAAALRELREVLASLPPGVAPTLGLRLAHHQRQGHAIAAMRDQMFARPAALAADPHDCLTRVLLQMADDASTVAKPEAFESAPEDLGLALSLVS